MKDETIFDCMNALTELSMAEVVEVVGFVNQHLSQGAKSTASRKGPPYIRITSEGDWIQLTWEGKLIADTDGAQLSFPRPTQVRTIGKLMSLVRSAAQDEDVDVDSARSAIYAADHYLIKP